ncbi:MAG: antitoxin MazE-like protein [Acidimicrobiales bacterium]
MRAPGFAEEAHRQSALAASSPDAADDQAFVDAISSFGDDGDDEE